MRWHISLHLSEKGGPLLRSKYIRFNDFRLIRRRSFALGRYRLLGFLFLLFFFNHLTYQTVRFASKEIAVFFESVNLMLLFLIGGFLKAAIMVESILYC